MNGEFRAASIDILIPGGGESTVIFDVLSTIN